jgi:hypothetical protein
LSQLPNSTPTPATPSELHWFIRSHHLIIQVLFKFFFLSPFFDFIRPIKNNKKKGPPCCYIKIPNCRLIPPEGSHTFVSL